MTMLALVRAEAGATTSVRSTQSKDTVAHTAAQLYLGVASDTTTAVTAEELLRRPASGIADLSFHTHPARCARHRHALAGLVQFRVFTKLEYVEVAVAVVKRVVIHMMHDLIATQRAPETRSGDHSMLWHMSAGIRVRVRRSPDVSVPIPVIVLDVVAANERRFTHAVQSIPRNGGKGGNSVAPFRNQPYADRVLAQRGRLIPAVSA